MIGGAEIRKDFGNINDIGTKILSDFFYYYRYDYNESDRHFSITGGVFPRTKCLEQWSTAFISEKQAWYDPYIEGVLFSYATPRTVVELGCDWMGKYGASSSIKEQFLIFSAGHHQIQSYGRIESGTKDGSRRGKVTGSVFPVVETKVEAQIVDKFGMLAVRLLRIGKSRAEQAASRQRQ